MSNNLDQQSRFAWLIVFLLFAGSVLNYMDRSLVSVIMPQVRRDLALTNADFGLAVNAFLVMYAAFYILGGRIADRLGYRGAFALTVAFWSIACMAHALVQGLRSLALCRAILGMGEGGFYPAAMRGAAQWFPPESRAKAVGLILSALCVGSLLTPPLVAWITIHYGWRASFLVIGALGLLLLPPWLLLHRHIHRVCGAGDPSAVSHPLPLGGEGGPPPAFSSARQPTGPGEGVASLALLSCHNIDQLLWHYHNFDNFLARQVLDHLFFRLRPGENFFLTGIDRDANSRPQFSVHLHGHLQFILGSKFAVKGRPGNAQQGLGVTKPFPELVGNVRRKERKHHGQKFQNSLVHFRADLARLHRSLQLSQLIDQFHAQGNVRVEMPAAFHVFRDVPKSLVRLAKYATLLGRKLTLCVSVIGKRLHTPEIVRML